ncbi:hypothetical protein [Streptomyces lunaelactis]|uniref:hypothetical protein n=1 Tax=Streptomyces lunaelactis TaxID=1535768 RepID=UPI002816732B|nr:hypothetical protein [Streptomyces lunaelactis]
MNSSTCTWAQKELGVSVRTIKRWVSAFHREREAGLIRAAPERSADAGGLGRADPRRVEMALEIMQEHKDELTSTQKKIIRSIGPWLAARYGQDEVKLPSKATAYRWLKELDKRQPTFRLNAKRNRDIAQRPGTAYGILRPTRPGEYILNYCRHGLVRPLYPRAASDSGIHPVHRCRGNTVPGIPAPSSR